MSEEIEKKGNKSGGAYIAIILILFVGVGFMVFKWKSVAGELTDAQNIIKEQNVNMTAMNKLLREFMGDTSADLEENFTLMLADYKELKKHGNSEQNAKIAQQEQEIQNLLADVKRGNMNASELRKARKEIETMREIMRGYVYEIDELQTLNLHLRNDLDQTTTQLTQTTADRDTYKTEAERLTTKVKEGQRLTVINSSFSSMAMKQSIGNEMKETNRAKNAVQVQTSFTIGKNAITDPGDKTIYMQVIGPGNKTLQNNFSGIVETEKGNVPFSSKRTIDYQNQSIDVGMFYSLRNEELDKGNYTVNIYCQGQLIGNDSFTLK